MRGRGFDQLDTGELWAVLDHDLQRPRERGLERELHVAEEFAGAALEVRPEAELLGAGVDEHVRGSVSGDAQVSGGALSVCVGGVVFDDDEPAESAVAEDVAADRVEYEHGAESGVEQAELFGPVGWVRGVVCDDDGCCDGGDGYGGEG